ncbi:MAG: hypothetical protein ABR583_01780 [Gaiellaceae bacterium]
MRNLCFAAALSEQRRPHHEFAFLLAYAGCATTADESAAEFEAFREMLLPRVVRRVGSITYETVADVIRTAGEIELSEWLETRLEAGVVSRAGAARAS